MVEACKYFFRTAGEFCMRLYHFLLVLVSAEVKILPSLLEYNDYLEEYFARENEITESQWNSSLPTIAEIHQMRTVLTSLYNDEDVNLAAILEDVPELARWINITELENYYVLHETIPLNSTTFPRFWGYTAIAKKPVRLRNIHHSAAHFESDGRVCHQAASLCESTGSVSVIAAGASRYAVKGNASAPCQPQYAVADVAHNADSMFHHCNMIMFDLVMHDLQMKQEDQEVVFIQWHGMAETSCLLSDVFITAGYTASSSIYKKNIPACKVRDAFNELSSSMNASTPDWDNSCHLTATTNVFGRYINGVPADLVCTTKANETHSTGSFVHIEQKRKSRSALNMWSNVLQKAFPATTSASVNNLIITIVFFISITFFLRVM